MDCAVIVSPGPLQNTSGSVNLQIVQISRHAPCAALGKVTIVKNHAAGVGHLGELVGAVVLQTGDELNQYEFVYIHHANRNSNPCLDKPRKN